MTKAFYLVWTALTLLFYTFFEYFLFIDSDGFMPYRTGLEAVYGGQFVNWLPQVVILFWLAYNIVSKSSLISRIVQKLSLATAMVVFLNILLPILVFALFPVGVFIAPIIKVASEVLPWIVGAQIFINNTKTVKA